MASNSASSSVSSSASSSGVSSYFEPIEKEYTTGSTSNYSELNFDQRVRHGSVQSQSSYSNASSFTSGQHTPIQSYSTYSHRRNSDGQDSALDKLAKNYEDSRQRSGPYLHQAVGTIFGSSTTVGSKSVGNMSARDDPERASIHSSRSSVAPANNSMLSGAPANSRIDPAALLLQQQLSGGNVPASMPGGGYTGGPLPGASATLPGPGGSSPAANDPVPLALQKRAPEFQLFKETTHDNAMLTGLNDLREENFLCDVTLMADDKPFQVLSYYNWIILTEYI